MDKEREQLSENTRQFRNGEILNRIISIHNSTGPTVVFVPGWLSTIYTWKYFLPVLSAQFRVEYFESREKPGTDYQGPLPEQSYAAHTADVANFLNTIEEDYAVIACSIGATTYLKALGTVRRKPVCQVLISPNLHAPTPRINWFLTPLYSVLLKLPIAALHALRPGVLFLVQLTSYKNDAHQIAGMVRAISEADLPLVTESARRVGEFRLALADLSTITVPTLIVSATRDDVHNSNDSTLINETLPKSKLVVFASFTETHGTKCAREVSRWLAAHLRTS